MLASELLQKPLFSWCCRVGQNTVFSKWFVFTIVCTSDLHSASVVERTCETVTFLGKNSCFAKIVARPPLSVKVFFFEQTAWERHGDAKTVQLGGRKKSPKGRSGTYLAGPWVLEAAATADKYRRGGRRTRANNVAEVGRKLRRPLLFLLMVLFLPVRLNV